MWMLYQWHHVPQRSMTQTSMGWQRRLKTMLSLHKTSAKRQVLFGLDDGNETSDEIICWALR
jgi:hypothetical protein